MDSVLIIEDSKDVNLMLAESLTDAGYAVKSIFTGTDGYFPNKKSTNQK